MGVERVWGGGSVQLKECDFGVWLEGGWWWRECGGGGSVRWRECEGELGFKKRIAPFRMLSTLDI